MYETLFLGKEMILLDRVDSTNIYLKNLLAQSENKIQGLTVITHQQVSGKGQMGNVWESEKEKNITLSLLLKPNLNIDNQFLLSKVIAIGISLFLKDLGVRDVKIKWPNDIYVGDKKIAGVLIENSLRSNKIENCIVGIGLNVNQTYFSTEIKNATSLATFFSKKFELEELIQQLLFFIERSYLKLQTLKTKEIDEAYLEMMYRFGKSHLFEIESRKVNATIIGVSSMGKLQMLVDENIKEFDLKEVRFL